jgi:hypothetical protein
MTPRADAVKDGRRRDGASYAAVARPRLDGGEHGVMLAGSGRFAGSQTRMFLMVAARCDPQVSIELHHMRNNEMGVTVIP